MYVFWDFCFLMNSKISLFFKLLSNTFDTRKEKRFFVLYFRIVT